MNEVDFLADEITNRYGTVKRARGCFLYTAKGIRLTDMYQEAGRAILGWGGGSSFTMLKNVLSRGITGSYNTDFTPQMTRAISELLASQRKIFVFSSKQIALQTSLLIAPESSSFWKPWNIITDNSGDEEDTTDWRTVTSVIVEPPLAWTSGIYILAVKDTLEMEAKLSSIEINSIRLPAPVVAAITRSIYDMIKALQERKESDWFIYDTVLTKYWKRKGPYLYPKVTKDQYGKFILYCLDNEVVISPVYEIPSIVPFGADKGVFSKVKIKPFFSGINNSWSLYD